MSLSEKSASLQSGRHVLAAQQLCSPHHHRVASFTHVFQDPFNEDDWESYATFTAKGLAQVVGDDLLCEWVNWIV